MVTTDMAVLDFTTYYIHTIRFYYFSSKFQSDPRIDTEVIKKKSRSITLSTNWVAKLSNTISDQVSFLDLCETSILFCFVSLSRMNFFLPDKHFRHENIYVHKNFR